MKLRQCQRCGCEIENPKNAQRYCTKCAEIVDEEKKNARAIEYRQKRKDMELQEKRRKKNKEPDGLAHDNERAREAGLTYGQWKAKQHEAYRWGFKRETAK